MKKLIYTFLITLYCISSYGQCTQNIGFDYDLGAISSNTPNFLLGTAITISSPFNLTAMGFISVSSGQNYKVAVYNDAGGSPGSLVTQGAGTAVEGATITDVPDVLLTPGTYYFMGVFETAGNISTASLTNSTVWYISHPFSSPLPEYFDSPLTYTDQDFAYYFIGTGPSALGTDTQTACNSYTWIDGNTYTSSNNTATFNIEGGAANGCDSLVTLNLTINNPATSTQTVTACDSYTWIDGNTYTSSNNTAEFTIEGGAANGCDSLVTLNLTINTVDTSVTIANNTLTANASGASYQWLDCNDNFSVISGATNQTYSPTISGSYAVSVTQNNCTDTSSCYDITTIGITEVAQHGNVFLFPNPFTSQSTLQSDVLLTNATLTIVNSVGQTVSQINNINGRMVTIQRNALPAGLYFVQLIDNNQQIAAQPFIIAD